MGKDVGSLIVSVSCGRRVHAELPLSVVLFPMGQFYGRHRQAGAGLSDLKPPTSFVPHAGSPRVWAGWQEGYVRPHDKVARGKWRRKFSTIVKTQRA